MTQKDEIIPTWIKSGNYEISLDKFYTNKKTSKYCYDKFLSFLKKEKIDISDYM